MLIILDFSYGFTYIFIINLIDYVYISNNIFSWSQAQGSRRRAQGNLKKNLFILRYAS